MDKLQSFISDVSKWADETFGPDRPTMPILDKLKVEILELVEAQEMYEDSPEMPETRKKRDLELADCFIILFNLIDREGLSMEDILDVCKEKLDINKTRKWKRVVGTPVYQHVDEEDE